MWAYTITQVYEYLQYYFGTLTVTNEYRIIGINISRCM